MALYGAAKAPAVPKYSDGTVQGDLATIDVGGTVNQTTVNVALALIVAKVNALIAHMNDGRT